MSATIAQTAKPARNWPRRVGLGLCALPLMAAAVLVLGSFFPSIAYVGVFGSLALSLWPGWFILIPLVLAALLWPVRASKVCSVLIALALVAGFGAAVVVARLVGVARANQVELGVGHVFGFSGSLQVVKPDEVVTYLHDQGEDLTLRLFRPKGPAPTGGWPVILHIHGGGWVGGSNADQSADMRWFADHGWVVASVDYSLSNDKRHLWNRVHDQLGCAMAWLNANIAERGGNIQRLAVRGGSAGGNLAINVAYMANAGTLHSACAGTIPKVRSVTPIYPGVDLTAIAHNTYPLTGPDVQSMSRRYTGGTPEQYPARYAAVNSATYINGAAPPTLMFITENDHLVPLASMQAFADRITQAGIPLRTVSIPHGEHGFEIIGIGNAIVRQVSLQFMQEHDSKIGTRKLP